MIVAVLKETTSGENRVAATPKTVKELIKNGLTVRVQSGAGESSYYSDQDYIDGGAVVTPDASSTLNGSDIIIKVAPATLEEMNSIPDESIYISLFQTARELDLVNKLSDKKVTGFSMHLIPRTSLAQSMDALSSQANVSGYKSVLIGASHLSVYMLSLIHI